MYRTRIDSMWIVNAFLRNKIDRFLSYEPEPYSVLSRYSIREREKIYIFLCVYLFLIVSFLRGWRAPTYTHWQGYWYFFSSSSYFFTEIIPSFLQIRFTIILATRILLVLIHVDSSHWQQMRCSVHWEWMTAAVFLLRNQFRTTTKTNNEYMLFFLFIRSKFGFV